jgi:hypothetical protein
MSLSTSFTSSYENNPSLYFNDVKMWELKIEECNKSIKLISDDYHNLFQKYKKEYDEKFNKFFNKLLKQKNKRLFESVIMKDLIPLGNIWLFINWNNVFINHNLSTLKDSCKHHFKRLIDMEEISYSEKLFGEKDSIMKGVTHDLFSCLASIEKDKITTINSINFCTILQNVLNEKE